MMLTEGRTEPLRVIGIESQEALHTLFKSVFTEQGYLYENYSTIESAVSSIEQDTHRDTILAVILDNHTPAGYPSASRSESIIQELKAVLPQKPIIMVTTDILDEEIRRRYIFEDGFWDVMPMPFDDIWMIGNAIRLANSGYF